MTKFTIDIIGTSILVFGFMTVCLSLFLLTDIIDEKEKYCREWGYLSTSVLKQEDEK